MGRPYFGPGGNGDLFYSAGYRSSIDAPAWLRSIGLDAYEYQAGNGLTASLPTLARIGEAAKHADIRMSIHAPYYISLASVTPEKRMKSIEYILETVKAADTLGAYLAVIHPGGAAKLPREEAMALARDTLTRLLSVLPEGKLLLGFETLGQINQLGTLEEIIALASLSPRFVPVVDFGHLHAREQGSAFSTADDYRRVFDRIASACGPEIAENLHCHFSHIEWGRTGEKKHLTFDGDSAGFGPPHEPFTEAIFLDGLSPTVICESAGTMPEDSLTMKHHYEMLKGNVRQ